MLALTALTGATCAWGIAEARAAVPLPDVPTVEPLPATGVPQAGLDVLPGIAAGVRGLDIVAELNRVRVLNGLRPLRASRALGAAAHRHTAAMGNRGFFSHSSPDGAPFWRRIERFYRPVGFRSWSVGENLLWDAPGVAAPAVVRTWLASAAHRANVLSRGWRDVGVGSLTFPSAPGVYGGRPVMIVTADFGARTR